MLIFSILLCFYKFCVKTNCKSHMIFEPWNFGHMAGHWCFLNSLFKPRNLCLKRTPLHSRKIFTPSEGRDVTVVACKSPKKAQGFLRDVFFRIWKRDGSRDKNGWICLCRPIKPWKKHPFEQWTSSPWWSCKGWHKTQLRILIGHQDPVINQPGFHGSCHQSTGFCQSC